MSGKKRGRHFDNPKNRTYMMRLSAGDINNLIFIQNITGKSKADIFRDGLKNEYDKAMKKYLSEY